MFGILPIVSNSILEYACIGLKIWTQVNTFRKKKPVPACLSVAGVFRSGGGNRHDQLAQGISTVFEIVLEDFPFLLVCVADRAIP
jgi:hypothetical protein